MHRRRSAQPSSSGACERPAASAAAASAAVPERGGGGGKDDDDGHDDHRRVPTQGIGGGGTVVAEGDAPTIPPPNRPDRSIRTPRLEVGRVRRQKQKHRQQQQPVSMTAATMTPRCFLLGAVLFCLTQAATFFALDAISANNNGHVAWPADGHNDHDDIDDDDGWAVPWPSSSSSSWVGAAFHAMWEAALPVIVAVWPSTRDSRERARFFAEQEAMPVLVVGGSDGSGTRAFVDALRELGVVVVADDAETFDVHASEMFSHKGWPGLVTAVLNVTHSASYGWDDLAAGGGDGDGTTTTTTDTTQAVVEREVRGLWRTLTAKYDVARLWHRREYERRIVQQQQQQQEEGGAVSEGQQQQQHRRLRVGGKTRKAAGRQRPPRRNAGAGGAIIAGRPTTFPALARNVSYVIKAPVAMLVLPVLARFTSPPGGALKFLHVVRDGRDVALSSNQSPVMKFYDAMYPDHEERGRVFQGDLWHVRAMQLWSDWNTQVYGWATKGGGDGDGDGDGDGSRKSDRHSTNGDNGVEYLWMRSEDLLPGSPRRLECLQALAEFVGSTLTPEQICCLSRQGPRDYGRSIVHDPRTAGNGLFGENGSGSVASSPRRSIEGQWKKQERDREQYAEKGEAGTVGQRPRAELEAKEASLLQKEEALRSWQAALEEREALLEEKPEDGMDANGSRGRDVTAARKSVQLSLPGRRLQSVHGGAKIVPSGFLRDFETWEGLAVKALESNPGEVKSFIVDSLITHGEDLLAQWDLNHLDTHSAGLGGYVTKRLIQNVVQKLRVKLQESRLNDHRNKQAERPGDPDVKNRYGKWQTVLQNNSRLADYFHQEGKKGLEIFGYYPYREVEYFASSNDTAYAVRQFNASAYGGIVCDAAVSCPS